MANKKKRAPPNQSKQHQKQSDVAGQSGNQPIDALKCTHLKRSVDANCLRKSLKKFVDLRCEDCEKDGSAVDNGGAVWACMKCGHKGCGRYSEHQHALSHSKVPRSETHCVVINMDTLCIWCYQCDSELPPDSYPASVKNLQNDMKRILNTAVKINDNENIASPKSTKGKGAPKEIAKSLNLSHIPIKGLSNLGNTCFFNSVVQNLMQTRWLRSLFVEGCLEIGAQVTLTPAIAHQHKFDADAESENADRNSGHGEQNTEPITITLDTELGSLTRSLRDLYQDFEKRTITVLTPNGLFSEICNKAKRFRSYEQQDSHELLRYLLDALRNEETIRRRTALFQHFNLKRNINPKSVPLQLQRRLKAYDQAAALTCVEQVFGGQLLQCVKCLQCNNVSVRSESFLDLSLPIIENRRKLNTDSVDDMYGKGTLQEKSNYALKKEKKLARKNAKGNTKKNANVDTKKTENDDIVEEMQSMTISNEEKNPTEMNRNVIPDQEAKNFGDSAKIVVDKLEIIENGIESDSEQADMLPTTSGENANGHDFDDDTLDMSIMDIDLDDCNDKWTFYTQPLDSHWTRPDTFACHLTDCLAQFMSTEMLSDKNQFGCEFCTKNQHPNAGDSAKSIKPVYTDALKKYIIFSPPAVLTLHLKRFHQSGDAFRKINKHVEFPKVLNLAPFCSKNGKRKPLAVENGILYSLYGIVSHSGRLTGGHYVAYVKLRGQSSNGCSPFVQKFHEDFVHAPPSIENGIVTNGYASESGSQDCNNNDRQTISTDPNGEATAHQTPDPSSIDNKVQNDQWYYISDSFVNSVSEDKVMSSEAYLLFYERIF